ncbi:unnamed protein product [Leptosia nina]|uniref:Carboxylic ester hydrolase n=1 Tax=Leptosia nina TaxID=320188 RepID=A0AAV1K3E4_9NEOP
MFYVWDNFNEASTSSLSFYKMVVVTVEQGRLEGAKIRTVSDDCDYYSFKGIPYAAPPVGKLRFLEPQPPKPWSGVRSATEHGPVCPQLNIFNLEKIPGSEDCLFLNVYTPDVSPKLPLPVMVFIHGGGLKCGSGNDDHYGPDFLVSHGVVLVTINYRLDIFGFLCLDTKEVPGNAGLKDQVEALKWVKRNISRFGGDTNNVTLFGESAGGLSTILHVLSPLSKGLFQRVVVMSGSPFCDWAIPFEPRKRAFALGKELGLETEDENVLLEFLQGLPSSQLMDTKPCILTSEHNMDYMKFYCFTYVVEKNLGQRAFLLKDPGQILKSGEFNDVDVIMGYTSHEMIAGLVDKSLMEKYLKYDESLLPRSIFYNCTPSKALEIADTIKKHYGIPHVDHAKQARKLIKFWSESVMIHNIQKLLALLGECRRFNTYFYQFSSVSERNVIGGLGKEYGIMGASHLDDLMYLFHSNLYNIPIDKGSRSYKMVQQFCSLITNFAKYGNPTPDSSLGVSWPIYDNKSKCYLNIDEHLTSGSRLHEDVVKFWENIYALAGVQ